MKLELTPQQNEPEIETGDNAPMSGEASQRWRAKGTAGLMLPAYGLLFLAVFYTVYFAASLLIPLVAAALLKIVLSPVCRRLQARGVPTPISAGAIVLLLSCGLVFSTILLSAPIADWVDRLPTITWQVKDKLQDILQPVQEVQQATKEVDELAKKAGLGGQDVSEVTIQRPTLSAQLFESIQTLVMQLAIIAVLLFFLLASGDLFKERIVALFPGLGEKKRVLKIMKQIENDASSYIITICVINLALGTAIALALWALGIPNAILWGLMAGLLNFIPYVGALIGASMIALVALISQDSLSVTIAAPLIYLGINTLEAQFLTPTTLGRKLTINPVAIFVFIFVWAWLWGVPGALMAVPILVVLRAYSDNVERLSSISLFLNADVRRVVAVKATDTPR